MREFAPAKVNLFLHVTGRRDDGYHLLDSLVAFPAVGDVIGAGVEEGAGFSLRIDGPFGAAIASEADNLVLRAARTLAARTLATRTGAEPRASLTLRKNLPVASGIGGGSSDAAAALRLLARLWRVEIPAELPLSLGADVPVCVEARPRRMAGVGEILTDAPILPDAGIVLVNPGVAIPTPAVFRARSGPFSPPASYPRERWSDAGDLAAWLSLLRNDLEAPAIAICPAVGEVLADLRRLRGCLLSRMSGSGATCFGLFGSAEMAARAASDVARPGWWTWGGAIDKGADARITGIAEPG